MMALKTLAILAVALLGIVGFTAAFWVATKALMRLCGTDPTV